MTERASFSPPVSLDASYEHYSPEISRHLKARRFKVETLTSLSLKRSKEAENAGYERIRHTNDRAKLPAYWLHPDEKPAYLACLSEIAQERQLAHDKKFSKIIEREKELNAALAQFTPAQQAMLKKLANKHPKAGVPSLIHKIKAFDNVGHAFKAFAQPIGAWYRDLEIEISLDETAQASRFHINAPIHCPRPGGGELNMTNTITRTFNNTITPKSIETLLNEAHTEHLLHLETLKHIAALGQQFASLSFGRAFDTLFIKVINGATPYDKLTQGMHSSLCNDLDGGVELVTWFNQNLSTSLPGASLHFEPKQHKKGHSASLSLCEFKIRITDIPLTELLSEWLLTADHHAEPGQYLAAKITAHLTAQLALFTNEALVALAKLNENNPEPDLLKLAAQKRDLFVKQLPGNIPHHSFSEALARASQKTRDHFALFLTMNDLKHKFGEDWIISRYLHARALSREIIIHAGPTNSGKTYQAFNEAYKSRHITYLAPLRLLAMEGYDRFLADGKEACLMTGEERIGNPDASCVASTIEMCNTNRVYDVAIVDEAQMLIDPERGAAWTAALLGVAARKVILTCPEESVLMLENLFSLTNENVTVHRFERKSPLHISKKPATLRDLEKGDALVAFSRRDLLSYKATLEDNGFSCSLIYGALSPEVRRLQARLFQEGETDILLSTDAIAMGLNLPISKMIISTDIKYNGYKEVEVDAALLRQIGGRAGRYGMVDGGTVMGLQSGVHHSVIKAFDTTKTFVLPHYPLALDSVMVQVIAEMIESSSLLQIQLHFKKIVEASHTKFKAKITPEQERLFSIMDQEDFTATLSLQDRFILACAPVNQSNDSTWQSAVQAKLKGKIFPSPVSRFDLIEADSEQALRELENCVSRLCLYRWLHYQFPEAFPDLEGATAKVDALNELIMRALSQRIEKRCQCCGQVIPLSLHHKQCDTCFRSQRDSSHYADRF